MYETYQASTFGLWAHEIDEHNVEGGWNDQHKEKFPA